MTAFLFVNGSPHMVGAHTMVVRVEHADTECSQGHRQDMDAHGLRDELKASMNHKMFPFHEMSLLWYWEGKHNLDWSSFLKSTMTAHQQ